MSMIQRAIVLLVLAALTGFCGVPVLAIMFAVGGLLLLDAVLLFGLLRALARLRRN
ncbi:MAG: hypothetical protein ACFB03_14345 [Paracoccaceae bacterium]